MIVEYANFRSTQSNKVMKFILADISREPLSSGEEVNILAYSAGGQCAVNVAERLTGNVAFDNAILVGAPMNEFRCGNIKKVYNYT